jgi:hypothetical protein
VVLRLSLIHDADILFAVNIDAKTSKRVQKILSVSDDEGIKAKLSEMMHSAHPGKTAQIWVAMMPNPGYQAGLCKHYKLAPSVHGGMDITGL